MDITVTTPALLFPAISLLLLAYTNRFLAITTRIRALHASYSEIPDEDLKRQIHSLQTRLYIIRSMQTLGVSSLFLCVVCMGVLFGGFIVAGKILFGISLLLLMLSLVQSMREIRVSVDAMNILIGDMNPKK